LLFEKDIDRVLVVCPILRALFISDKFMGRRGYCPTIQIAKTLIDPIEYMLLLKPVVGCCSKERKQNLLWVFGHEFHVTSLFSLSLDISTINFH